MRRFVLLEVVLPQAIVAAVAIILASVPLFDVLGFESFQDLNIRGIVLIQTEKNRAT